MKKALVIDDDKEMRDLISDLLEKEDIAVEHAGNGLIGVTKIKEKNYDIIFLDIIMPGLNGQQVLGILNKLKKSLPIIIISGYLTKDIFLNLKNMGVKGFLSKPFSGEQFYQAVKQVCPLNIE